MKSLRRKGSKQENKKGAAYQLRKKNIFYLNSKITRPYFDSSQPNSYLIYFSLTSDYSKMME